MEALLSKLPQYGNNQVTKKRNENRDKENANVELYALRELKGRNKFFPSDKQLNYLREVKTFSFTNKNEEIISLVSEKYRVGN